MSKKIVNKKTVNKTAVKTIAVKCITCRKNKKCHLKPAFMKKCFRWGVSAIIVRCDSYDKAYSDSNEANQQAGRTREFINGHKGCGTSKIPNNLYKSSDE
jgi:hypothetical protein